MPVEEKPKTFKKDFDLYMEGIIMDILSILFTTIFPIATGYLVKSLGYISQDKSSWINTLTVISISPFNLVLSIWKLNIQIATIALPLLGACISMISMLCAVLLSKLFHNHDKRQIGSYALCGMFSNIGTIGPYILYILLGETGYGLSVIYMTYFTPLQYTVGFYIADHYAMSERSKTKSVRGTINKVIRFIPTVALLVGLIFNLSGVPPLEFSSNFLGISIPISTSLFLFSIGLTLNFSNFSNFKKEWVSISLIKFLFSPLIGLGLTSILHLSNLLTKIVFIQASMPVAFASLIVSNLFGLDQDLANSCWLFTTCISLLTTPMLVYMLNFL